MCTIRLASIGRSAVCGMGGLGRTWRRHMRLWCGVMRRLGLRASAVSSMLRVGNGEDGEREREKKSGPTREDMSTRQITKDASRDTAAYRRGASGYRGLSCCAPRHGGPSFSIERRAAPPPTWLAAEPLPPAKSPASERSLLIRRWTAGVIIEICIERAQLLIDLRVAIQQLQIVHGCGLLRS
jgi:hypothetical protein